MIEHSASPTPAPDGQAKPRLGRATGVTRRERCIHLLASGYNCSQIAKMVRASVATVRREIDRGLAERRLETPERFARAQIARLAKALRLAEAAIKLGELKAVATYLRIVAALDRYHELAAGSPPPVRSTKAPSLALPAPPTAPTVAALHANDGPATEEVPGAAEEIRR